MGENRVHINVYYLLFLVDYSKGPWLCRISVLLKYKISPTIRSEAVLTLTLMNINEAFVMQIMASFISSNNQACFPEQILKQYIRWTNNKSRISIIFVILFITLSFTIAFHQSLYTYFVHRVLVWNWIELKMIFECRSNFEIFHIWERGELGSEFRLFKI